MLIRLCMSVLVLSALCTAADDSPGSHQVSLREVEADVEQLREQLHGYDECAEKLNTVQQKNALLRGRVDIETPALEKKSKDATEQLAIVRADTARWNLYLKLVIAALVVTWGSTLLNLIKDNVNKLIKLQKARTSPKLENKKKL